MTNTTKEIKFYQNNPCVIVRDINDEFCEIQLNVHFAADIDTINYMVPAECLAPNTSHNEDEMDSINFLLDDIQNEEHSILCLVEKRLLNDHPIEIRAIGSLVKQIKSENDSLNKTKQLHEEWRKSSNVHSNKLKDLQLEIESLNRNIINLNSEKQTAKEGIKSLSERYNKIIVEVGKYSSKARQITVSEYDQLVKRDEVLSALEAGGVDNWEWYEESLNKDDSNG